MTHYKTDYAIINAEIVVHQTDSQPSNTSSTTEGILHKAGLLVSQGKIQEIYADSTEAQAQAQKLGLEIIDAQGAYLGPGLIDMHIHGCGGTDTGQEDLQTALETMANFLAQRGITSFQPAVFPSVEVMEKAQAALEASPLAAYHVCSIYNEGPFIALEKKGGLPAESLRDFTAEYMEQLLSFRHPETNRTLLGTMTVAPELEGADVAWKMAAEAGSKVAWGHSASYADMLPANKGVHLTHIFNAMNGIDHRRPGLAIVPFLKQYHDATYELIADTVHVNQQTMEFLIHSLGTQRLCLISDAMAAAGMGPGESVYLGRQVICDGKVSRYKEGNILIGSAMLTHDTGRQLVEAGLIDVAGFFRIASTNPARVLGLTDRGLIQVGHRADFVLLNESLHVQDVFIGRTN
ncbi:MAG: N-acetylglucosamine-6-phosphate deacetylase [Treponema sp.]|nr:N-acetylglucosamine-6-phosphate deacetylase [Treponema sp.]